ncbi:hypothetical protein RJ639_008610 [Escallonia herrerae]|uniref:Uncharacterized protein n=1 Tax=Escallonia herrerae TaxID=1293975 RepID=A0AA88VP68_9ASTE|nr:hypothetical protein RJ639_008610 [Escallonia herrerae]
MKDNSLKMEIRDGPSNQVTNVRGKGKSPRKTLTKDTSQPKACWDEFSYRKFIELCMNQIKSENKPGTHFNRDGDWQNWDNLMHGESSLGWDLVRKTNNPKLAKFRYKNLDTYKNYYDPMFRDITATVSFGVDDTTIVGEEGDNDDVQPLVGSRLANMTTNVNTRGLQIVFPELPKRSLAISEKRSNKRKKGKVSKCTSLSEQIDGMLSLLSNKNNESQSSNALTIKKLHANKYHVVDAGYPNMKGYLAPYKGLNIQYHMPEFHRVERTFGVWKARWARLHDMPYYDFGDQVKIVLASTAVQNYIRKMGSSKNAVNIAEQERYYSNDANGGDDNNDRGTPFTFPSVVVLHVVPKMCFQDFVEKNGLGLTCASMATSSSCDGPADETNLIGAGEIRIGDLSMMVADRDGDLGKHAAVVVVDRICDGFVVGLVTDGAPLTSWCMAKMLVVVRMAGPMVVWWYGYGFSIGGDVGGGTIMEIGGGLLFWN